MGRRDETFLLYYWEDFEQYTLENPSCIYCLSESSVQIILSALRFVNWRTRWRLNRQDNNRRLDDNVIWNKIDALGALAQKEIVTDMSCDLENLGETLATAITSSSNATALEHVAQALMAMATKPCCEGSGSIPVNGGVTGSWTDGDGITHPIYGDNPLTTNDGMTPPDGFETYEEYLLNKCQVANMVFDGWIGSMRGLGALTVFNATVLAGLIGLAIPGIIILPVAAIPIMIGALVALGSFVAMFVEICNSLEENRQQIVCDLYDSDTVETMTSVLADALDAAIALLSPAPGIGEALKLVALTLVNGDTLSQLMSGIAGVSYPDADCTSCHETTITVDTGTITSQVYNNETEDWTFEVSSAGGQAGPATYRTNARDDSVGFIVTDVSTICTGVEVPGPGFVFGYYVLWGGSGVNYLTGSVSDIIGLHLHTFALYDDGPFTVEFTGNSYTT